MVGAPRGPTSRSGRRFAQKLRLVTIEASDEPPSHSSGTAERNIDAWLFYDHHHRDPIAYRVLGLPGGLMSRVGGFT